MKALSNYDIIKLCQHKNLPLNAVLMRDEVKKKLNYGFSVINLETTRQDGSHWTCVLYTPLTSYYFDSYGFVPPLELEEVIRPYTYNNTDIQDFDSEACGYYCVAFIKFMNDKKDKDSAYKAFTELFKNNRKENDTILKRYLANEL